VLRDVKHVAVRFWDLSDRRTIARGARAASHKRSTSACPRPFPGQASATVREFRRYAVLIGSHTGQTR
jgi:hypothetical protein